MEFAAAMAVWLVVLAPQDEKPTCESFSKLVHEVYVFEPSTLSADEQKSKAARMDEVWTQVKAHSAELVPCLRKLLADPKANAWFLVDGSALLATVDPTPASKAIQAREWCRANFADVNPESFVRTVAALGVDGMDISAGASRWLTEGETYCLALHGLHEVDPFEGAMILFGSMDEAKATPALAKLASDPNCPKREWALRLLTFQSTPEALAALRKIDLAPFPEAARKGVAEMISKPPSLPDEKLSPKLTREYLLTDIRGFLGEGPMQYDDDVTPTAWAIAASHLLQPADVVQLRKARRKRVSVGNQHALEDYMALTGALRLVCWKPELFK
jgi:hypothetical protein